MKSLTLADHPETTVQHWLHESLDSFRRSRVLLTWSVRSFNVSDTWIPTIFLGLLLDASWPKFRVHFIIPLTFNVDPRQSAVTLLCSRAKHFVPYRDRDSWLQRDGSKFDGARGTGDKDSPTRGGEEGSCP